MFLVMTAGAQAATLNVLATAEGCEQFTFAVPNVVSGMTLEAPVPECRGRTLSATITRVRAMADDADPEPLWQVEFTLRDVRGRGAKQETIVLMQPTMIARANEQATFISGWDAVQVEAVTVRDPEDAVELVPISIRHGVTLLWSIDDELGAEP